MLATVWVGMFILSASLFWSPGFNKFGTFQLIDLYKTFTSSEEAVIRLTSFLGAIIAITGQYRMPPNSPPCRRLMFKSSLWNVVFNAILIESNLGSFAHFTIDAWTWPGRIAILFPGLAYFFYAYGLLRDSIAGPIKGRETVPLMTTHTSGFATSTTLIF